MYEESFRNAADHMAWRGHIRRYGLRGAGAGMLDYAPTLLEPHGSRGSGRKWTAFRCNPCCEAERRAAGETVALLPVITLYPAVGSVRAHYGIRHDRYKMIPLVSGRGRNGASLLPLSTCCGSCTDRAERDPAEVIMFTRRGRIPPYPPGAGAVLAEKRGELGIRLVGLQCRLIRTSGKSFPDASLPSWPSRKNSFSMYMLICRSGLLYLCEYIETLLFC